MADKRVSEMTVLNQFYGDSKIYGIRESGGNRSYAYSLEALQSLIRNTSSLANYFTLLLNITRSGQDITVPANREWNIFGEAYTNPASVTRTVPYAAAGKTRIDLLVANTANTFVIVTGLEVDLPESPSAPAVPFMTLQATFLIVTESTISDPVEPSSGEYYGTYPTVEDFNSGAPRGLYGAYAFVLNATQNISYNFDGTNWITLERNPYAKRFNWNIGEPTVFTLPFAVKAKQVFVNEVPIYADDLDWHQLSNTVVIANSKLFEDGTRILITN